MFYHVSREATGDSAENHPYLSYTNYRKDNAFIVISLNTFMRDAHHEHWDGFSTNRVADRLYIEFENTFLSVPQITGVYPWYHELGYLIKTTARSSLFTTTFTISIANNVNVSDTLLPLQEGAVVNEIKMALHSRRALAMWRWISSMSRTVGRRTSPPSQQSRHSLVCALCASSRIGRCSETWSPLLTR